MGEQIIPQFIDN